LTNLAVAYPDIEFIFNKERIHFRNLKQIAKNFSEASVFAENDRVKMIFAPSGLDEEFRCHSYVNGIYIKNGGSHVEYALSKIIETVRVAVKKKHKIDVLPNQIRQHLLFASWINGFKNLRFDSQTKERVRTGIDFEKIAKQILATPEIIDPMIAAILYKKELAAAAELRKLNKDADRANLRKIIKFTDASQKNNREECMLFITEGDSANASVLSARTAQIGSYPLRGKPLNALATDAKELLANKEFADLISIIGHKVGHKIKSRNDLRFGKIVICSDQDADGQHIRGLVLALYKKFWPEAFDLGLLYIFNTPLMKVTVGKEDLLFYSLDEFKRWEQNNIGKKYTSRYLKGLGSSTAKDFKRYFSEMDKNLKQVKIEDVKDLELFDLVFGKETGMTDKRKEWLGIAE
jgi:DNA gyrase/topoisomerase IV subunit B